MLTKDELIKKILKYSKDNNGQTPSEKQFYEYVGIGIYDLKKCGWAYYGELVREAGLTPNKFDKTKYTHDQLCELFIETIREKNTWPTRGRLDVKHHINPNFPDSSTFYKKLGLTGKLAQSILEFVEDKQNYDDVIKICNAVFKEHKDLDQLSEDQNLIKGYVYLGKQHGKYKIGRTDNLQRRREDITLLGSEPIEWEHSIETDDMKGVERYWHNRFQKKRERGEWFKLSRQDVKAFKRWKKIY
jgi:hypothetical protein